MKPVKVYKLNPEIEKQFISQFSGYDEGFMQFGEEKYLLPSNFLGYQDKVKQMEVRQDDIWVASFPRSGTTWTQELVWLITNDMDFEKAKEISLLDRYLFLEVFCFMSKTQKIIDGPVLQAPLNKSYQGAEEIEERRYFKTHLPFSLLPPNLLDTTKVVYVARDPRDVAVSFYHHNTYFKAHGYRGDFKSYWKLFRNDLVSFAPYFAHLKEAWKLRHHKNMIFLFYEELSTDLEAVLRRVIQFFGKHYGDDKIKELCRHLHIDSMKQNKSVSLYPSDVVNKSEENSFIRKGKVGDWRLSFDEEMTKDAEVWIEEKLKGTDISFPSYVNSS